MTRWMTRYMPRRRHMTRRRDTELARACSRHRFTGPTVLKMPKRSSSHGPLAQLRGHCHWPRQGEDQPSLITPPSVVKTTVGARGVEQIVWNFSEAGRVSLYPCPNLLARSRASNHKQGHDALSSHTDRVTLRKAYWEALQRTGQICSL